jgi:hypothetical protein
MSENNSSGLSLSGILLVIFVTLKLAQVGLVADWSWWWVLSPLWIPIVIILLVFLFGFTIAMITKIFE